MGNTESSAPPPLPLREDDAFAIATHWKDKLRNWVRPSTHDEYVREPVAFRDVEHLGVRHFEWVLFGNSDDRVHRNMAAGEEEAAAAAAARASTIVWFALTNCAGFSGRENPRFWKRVFSVLADGDARSEIADEVRFFENPDRPFPCVRIVARYRLGGTILRAFFWSGTTDRELKHVLRRLEPHVADRAWWRRKIPVEVIAIDLFGFYDWKVNVCLRKRPRCSRMIPAFRVVAARTSNAQLLMRTTELGQILSVFNGVDLQVSSCVLQSLEKLPRSVIDPAREQPRSDQRLHFETIIWRDEPLGKKSFVTLCSAIPHTRLVTSLEIDNWGDFNATDGAWLGYALFHPTAATSSSLTTLNVRRPFKPAVLQILRLTAAGNNLLLAMGASRTVSSAYHEARVIARARLFAAACILSQVLYTFPRELTVTLCVTSLDEINDGTTWVHVIVPGFGLGWVLRKLLHSVTSRAPGKSTLRRLEYPEVPQPERRSEPRPPLPFGATLTHLKLDDATTTQDLLHVLHCCPNLHALRVQHNGECWSHPNALTALPPMPRLQTLELVINGEFFPLRAPQLDDLICFRVIDRQSERTAYEQYRKPLLETLRRYPQLTHVFWSGQDCKPGPWWEVSGYRPWWNPPQGADLRGWQSTSYELLGEHMRDELDYSNRVAPLPVGVKLAFLSVFRGTTATTMPRLPSEVVSLVFAFGATRVRRQVLIRQ